MLEFERIILVNNYDDYLGSIEKHFASKVRRDYGGYFINDEKLGSRVDIQSVNSNNAVSMIRGCTYKSVVIIDKNNIDGVFLDKVINEIRRGNENVEIIELTKEVKVETLVNDNNNNKPKSSKVEVKKYDNNEKQTSVLQKTTDNKQNSK